MKYTLNVVIKYWQEQRKLWDKYPGTSSTAIEYDNITKATLKYLLELKKKED